MITHNEIQNLSYYQNAVKAMKHSNKLANTI